MYQFHRRWARTGAVAAAAVLPLIASPAFAGETSLRDARGDVWNVEEGGGNPTPALGATFADVLRATFRHTNSRVAVGTKFVDLQPVGKRFEVIVEMRDEHGKNTTAMLRTSRRNRQGQAWLMTGRGRDIDCKVWHTIDYAENTARLGFSRRCIGNPRSLKFRLLSYQVRSDWAYAYVDNPHNARPTPGRAWTEPVRHG